MESTDKNIKILNDLFKINQERVDWYKKISYTSTDFELKSLFSNMADQSRKNATEITREMFNKYPGLSVEQLNKTNGLYEVWTNRPLGFAGDSIKDILNSCEFGEEAILKAYQTAKEKITTGNPHVIELIERQEESFHSSYEIIRAYRQTYSVVRKPFLSY